MFAVVQLGMLQVLTNGLVQGLAIALLAWAFVLVYVPTRVFHLGLAGIYSLSPYIGMLLLGEGAPELAAIAGAIAAGAMTIEINKALSEVTGYFQQQRQGPATVEVVRLIEELMVAG